MDSLQSGKETTKKAITDSRRVHPNTDHKARLRTDTAPLAWKPFIRLTRIDILSRSYLMFRPCGKFHQFLDVSTMKFMFW